MPNSSLQKKPDFLCVSPHKTGTSWLHVNLQKHPQVWLPPKKELWVLNQLHKPYQERWKQYFNRTDMPGDNRVYFETFLRNILKKPSRFIQNLPTLWWWVKFLTLPYSMQNYSRLFPQNSLLTTGDITPNYYFLELSTIEKYAQYNPNTFIILIIRNPVDRAWSYARMTIGEHYQKPLPFISIDEWIAYFDSLHYWWKPYQEQIVLWQQYFSRFFVGFYDLLKDEPSLFLKQICQFLQIEDDFFCPDIEKVVNQGTSLSLPLELRDYLSKQYRNEIIAISELVDSPYPQQWVKKINCEFN